MNRIQNSLLSESGQSRKITLNSNGKSFHGLIQKILQFQKQIISKLDLIYDIRYIEKIARPIQKDKKQALILELTQKIKYVHDRMQAMENHFDLSYLTNQRDPSKSQKVKKKIEMVILAKLSFFNIRKKYVQTFTYSSFIHLNKVTEIFQLKHNIQFIEADKWLSKCLQKAQKGCIKQDNILCCC